MPCFITFSYSFFFLSFSLSRLFHFSSPHLSLLSLTDPTSLSPTEFLLLSFLPLPLLPRSYCLYHLFHNAVSKGLNAQTSFLVKSYRAVTNCWIASRHTTVTSNVLKLRTGSILLPHRKGNSHTHRDTYIIVTESQA